MNDYNWSPGRLAAGARVGVPRSQARGAARRRHRDRRRPRRVRGNGRDAVRVALRLARAVANQRGRLALGARQLGPALSLRSANRQAEAPDHDRRRPGHADRAHRREDANASGSARTAARRDRIRTSCTSTATGLDGGSRVVSLTPDDGTHAMQMSPSGRYLIDTYSKPDVPPVVVLRDARAAQSRCRSRRPTSRSCSPRAGSRRCRSR